MEIKVLISTPKGCASSTEKKIRGYIIGKNKLDIKLYVSPGDDQIIWHMTGDVRACMKASRNVNLFDTIIGDVFKNKAIRRRIDKKDLPELENMLKNHTSVEIIKKATEEEVQENKKETWWEKVKRTFTRGKF